MIRFLTEDGKLICDAKVKGYGIYLDTDSLMDLAEREASRRQRFVEALQRGGTLLFSWTNAIELAGPQGASASAVQAFLDSLGPHWIPLELNPWKVIDRERAGIVEQAPVSEWFMKAYAKERAHDLSVEGGKVLDQSAEAFFRLGAVVSWVQKKRDSIRQHALRVAQALRDRLKQLRANYENDPASLDRQLPPVPFDERWPGTFVCFHLQRMLVVKEKVFRFEDNDAFDFCHAVLATAFGSLVTLDKRWKGRVESLPRPNRLAKVYYRPELDQLVGGLESLVTSR